MAITFFLLGVYLQKKFPVCHRDLGQDIVQPVTRDTRHTTCIFCSHSLVLANVWLPRFLNFTNEYCTLNRKVF